MTGSQWGRIRDSLHTNFKYRIINRPVRNELRTLRFDTLGLVLHRAQVYLQILVD